MNEEAKWLSLFERLVVSLERLADVHGAPRQEWISKYPYKTGVTTIDGKGNKCE